MSVSREELLKECGQELDVTIIHEIETAHDFEPQYGPGCGICGVNFEEHDNKTVHFASKHEYDPDPIYKNDMDALMKNLNAYHGSNNCPSCGGSLCVEEYHDCESDRAWRAAH